MRRIGLAGEKERGLKPGGIEGFVDEDVEQAITGVASEREGGMEQCAHCFAAAGEQAENLRIGVGAKPANDGEDKFGGGGVVGGGADIGERSGGAMDRVGPGNQRRRFEGKARVGRGIQ